MVNRTDKGGGKEGEGEERLREKYCVDPREKPELFTNNRFFLLFSQNMKSCHEFRNLGFLVIAGNCMRKSEEGQSPARLSPQDMAGPGAAYELLEKGLRAVHTCKALGYGRRERRQSLARSWGVWLGWRRMAPFRGVVEVNILGLEGCWVGIRRRKKG